MRPARGRLDYRNACVEARRGGIDDLAGYVRGERERGISWSNIAKACGRSEAALRAKFDRVVA